ncbi:MAG: DHH family phosphoesterase [Methanobacteriota archaeon]
MSILDNEIARAAEAVRTAKSAIVVTHIDADGICAGAIASRTLEALSVPYEIRFLKKLDEPAAAALRAEKRLIWLTDLGSGQLPMLKGLDAIITDHHVPSAGGEPTAAQRMDLTRLAEALDVIDSTIPQVNPHLIGLDGGRELSGAGAAYLVAKSIDPRNVMLSPIAIIGAVGDLQDRSTGKLGGLNAGILEDARKTGLVEAMEDISFFGRETRPAYKMLQYQSDPKLPGLANDEEACIRFMIDAKIKLRDGENWRRWIDLNRGERMRIIQRLEALLAKHDQPSKLTSEVYILTEEEPGTPLHDAKEFATLLNSCGRYEKGDIGLGVAMGDRGKILQEAYGLQQGHRRNLVDCLQVVRDVGINGMDGLQYFDAGDRIMDSVVGTVAGMALNSDGARRDVPIFGLARADDGVKVSARGTREMVARGLDLSAIMKAASERVGGFGGGHNIAAGATVPAGREMEFLGIASELVRKQLGAGS